MQGSKVTVARSPLATENDDGRLKIHSKVARLVTDFIIIIIIFFFLKCCHHLPGWQLLKQVKHRHFDVLLLVYIMWHAIFNLLYIFCEIIWWKDCSTKTSD